MKNLRKSGKRIRIFNILGLALIIFSIIMFAKNNFSNNHQQVFQANIIDNQIIAKEDIENITISQNIPIPQELKDKMEKEQKAKEEKEKKIAQEKAEKEKQAKIAKAKKEAEEKKKAEALKIAKAKNTITSRGSNTTRNNKTTTSTKKNTTTKKGKYITFNVSFYCPCRKCCGSYANGITASGKYAKANHTIAAPKGYSFGTKIYLEGMGTYTVEDRGGAIYGNRIDVYVNSHSEALRLGRKQVKGYVVND